MVHSGRDLNKVFVCW